MMMSIRIILMMRTPNFTFKFDFRPHLDQWMVGDDGEDAGVADDDDDEDDDSVDDEFDYGSIHISKWDWCSAVISDK